MTLILKNIHKLYRVAQQGERFKTGAAMSDAVCLEQAWLAVEAGRITAFGQMDAFPHEAYAGAETIDCTGKLVMPGFVDSHTHLVFPKTREQEFVYRLQGISYEEIAKRGGGILNSAKATQQISEEQLLAETLERAREIISLGTTTVEIKSGYGLTLDSELKLLRVAKKVQQEMPLRVKTTFLGAHAIPVEWQSNRQGYIDLVCEEMLPQVIEEGLADYIDVFCDTGFFTVEETEYILQKGLDAGLPAKIHANELDFSGGVQVGVKMGAYSVDHLERSGPDEIEALKGSETVPTLLPSVAFFLGIDYGPARGMIEAELPLALATDYNPGSSPGGSMPFVMSLACLGMRMLPEEALVASTLNAAFSMRMSEEIGSIEVGKYADLVITRPMDQLARIPYSYAQNPVETTIINGKVVHTTR
ncbi:imidazolonepropionase [Pontibacter sp. G13]|uniref:imidazolonepropionase n=1 Tax=Pontibacter sp. G13 TaxID=3074898 RepID=UPI00288948CE|nr:imidazolonepropionase [Pontibacter sp. G13]WNJ20231.1 imidazolonepropionase [Pontibacter sp. G13]